MQTNTTNINTVYSLCSLHCVWDDVYGHHQAVAQFTLNRHVSSRYLSFTSSEYHNQYLKLLFQIVK